VNLHAPVDPCSDRRSTQADAVVPDVSASA
jgi:hypothetical protein